MVSNVFGIYLASRNDMITPTWSSQHLQYVCDYPPYRTCGEPNPNKTQDTYRIMDIKNPQSKNYRTSLMYFQGELLAFFRIFPEFAVHQVVNLAIVPSSTMDNQSDSLRAIVQHLNLNLNQRIYYNPNYLVRIKSIPSAKLGGVRNEGVHRESIEVRAPINPAIPIVLLDDVYTTGSSINACERLLREAGAQTIYKLVLGKTV